MKTIKNVHNSYVVPHKGYYGIFENNCFFFIFVSFLYRNPHKLSRNLQTVIYYNHLFQQSSVSFLRDGQPDSLRTGQGHHRLASFPDQEDVGQSRGEQISGGIFDVHDVVG